MVVVFKEKKTGTGDQNKNIEKKATPREEWNAFFAERLKD